MCPFRQFQLDLYFILENNLQGALLAKCLARTLVLMVFFSFGLLLLMYICIHTYICVLSLLSVHHLGGWALGCRLWSPDRLMISLD